MAIFTSLLKWGKDPVDSFSIKTNKILYDLSLYYVKQIDSMSPCVCSVIDHRRRQNVVRTSVTRSAIASCVTFLFLPHFDVICDLLGSFSIDDGNGNDNATNKEFDWPSEEK